MNEYKIANFERIVREKYLFIASAIVLVALALRFFHLGGTSLWLDEAVYANNSMTDFWSFIENTRTRNSSPILLPYLYHIFGESLRDPFLIRVPPAIFSILSVVVMLALPRAGVSFTVAALAAFILGIAPAQIEYAQEVREYSLSVLLSCALIFSYAYALNSPSTRALYYFALIFLLTPFVSYGLIFMSLAVLAPFLIISRLQHKYRSRELIIPFLSLLVGILLTYQLTAKYQINIANAWYLAGNYPPGEMLSALKWLAKSGLSYFALAIGGRLTGFLSILLLMLYIILTIKNQTDWVSKQYFFFVLVALVLGSVFAASIGAYPFGGIRQHLFATPLVILCVAQSVVSLGSVFPKIGVGMVVSAFALIVALNSVFKMPPVYAERQDIVSAVSEGLKEISDSDAEVYVYYGAKPALKFHFPDRNFFLGKADRGDIEGIGKEIIALAKDCHVNILFSHVFQGEDNRILSYLDNAGLTLIEDRKYRGARVVRLSRCGD